MKVPVQFMSFSEAMEIVSQFGYTMKSESLLDAISDMEDNYDYNTISNQDNQMYNIS